MVRLGRSLGPPHFRYFFSFPPHSPVLLMHADFPFRGGAFGLGPDGVGEAARSMVIHSPG